jgi:hypothetical protein
MGHNAATPENREYCDLARFTPQHGSGHDPGLQSRWASPPVLRLSSGRETVIHTPPSL